VPNGHALKRRVAATRISDMPELPRRPGNRFEHSRRYRKLNPKRLELEPRVSETFGSNVVVGMDGRARIERVEVSPGCSLVADVAGSSGPPVLLLHGIPGSRRTWRRVAELLAGRYRVVTPDLLGFGDSSDPPGDFHAAGQADALVRLLDGLGIPRAHVVGFDFGGPVALTLYADAPERFLSLTLAATNAFTDTPIPAPLGLARMPVVGDALLHAFCSWPGIASLWLGAVRDRRALSWSAFVRAIPSRRSRQWTRRIFLDSLRNLSTRYPAIEATLPKVACSCTVLWGDGDPFFPITVGERTATRIPGATFRVLPHCGHFIPEERPAAVVAAVQEHVRVAQSSMSSLK
jgi:pimeloyl-ACP methyl ester carboxylesterase